MILFVTSYEKQALKFNFLIICHKPSCFNCCDNSHLPHLKLGIGPIRPVLVFNHGVLSCISMQIKKSVPQTPLGSIKL